MRLLIIAIAATMTSAGALAQETEVPKPAKPQLSAQEQQNLLKLQRGFVAIEKIEARRAIATLEAAIKELPADSWMRYSAVLLHAQMTGQFKSRQAVWLNRSVIDTVVLVPDELSFLAAVSNWKLDQFWPVLIEDAWFAPMFIRAFRPRRVVRWSIKDANPEVAAAIPADQEDAKVVESLKFLAKQLDETLQKNADYTPPGVVIINPNHAQRCGGLALALGRFQPVVTLTTPGVTHAKALNFEQVQQLNVPVIQALKQWKVVAQNSWCGLTLAGDYPYRYRNPQYKRLQAVDDLLGRDNRGIRAAVTGRLIGDSVQSVYQAMCSLFIQPQRVLMLNTYRAKNNRDPFLAYDQKEASSRISRLFHVAKLDGEKANLVQLRRQTQPVNKFDWFWMNTSGSPVRFGLQGGKPGHAEDMPIGHPSIIHMIHSYSTENPYDTATLAGRSIAGGAYWYFGSVAEPLLQAFAPPTGMSAKVLAGTPLAFASRKVPGQPYYGPWKLMLIGDPLYSLRHPAPRIEGTPLTNARPVQAVRAGVATPQQLLRNAALTDETELLSPALACASQSKSLQPDVMACVAATLYKNAKYAELADVNVKTAASHPIAAAFVYSAAEVSYRRNLNAKRVDAAGRNLMRILRLGSRSDDIAEHIKRWLSTMDERGQRREAIQLIVGQIQDPWPEPTQQALTQLGLIADGEN